VATKEIEGVRALSYAQIGFYGDEPGYAGTFEGLTTVTLGPTTPSGTTPQAYPTNSNPAAPVVFGGVSYGVERHIVWSDAQGGATSTSTTIYAQAYKRVTVKVSWTDQAGSHLVRQDSIIYPGNQGPYPGPAGGGTTTTTVTLCPPASPTLNPPAHPAPPADQAEIDLSWSQPGGTASVTSYSIQYATNSAMTGATAVNNLAPTTTSYQVTPLASGTTYWFTVTANCQGGSGASSNPPASAQTAPLSSGCSLLSLSVTDASTGSSTTTYLQNNGKLSASLSLALTTSGTCPHGYAVAGKDPSGAADPGSQYALATSGGGSYGGTVAASNSHWSTGVHTFTVIDTTNGSTTSTTKTFVVCAAGSQGSGGGC
jgi:hypothetical protein